MFYWKVKKDLPLLSKEKLTALSVAVIIVIVSILGLVDFTMKKVSS